MSPQRSGQRVLDKAAEQAEIKHNSTHSAIMEAWVYLEDNEEALENSEQGCDMIRFALENHFGDCAECGKMLREGLAGVTAMGMEGGIETLM